MKIVSPDGHEFIVGPGTKVVLVHPYPQTEDMQRPARRTVVTVSKTLYHGDNSRIYIFDPVGSYSAGFYRDGMQVSRSLRRAHLEEYVEENEKRWTEIEKEYNNAHEVAASMSELTYDQWMKICSISDFREEAVELLKVIDQMENR